MPMTPVPESLQDLVAASLSAATLHESTAPDVLADIQRAEVKAFFHRRPFASVAEASEELVLSEWSIEVRLAELAGCERPYRKRAVPVEDSENWKLMHKGKR
jgi:hypothetical protein